MLGFHALGTGAEAELAVLVLTARPDLSLGIEKQGVGVGKGELDDVSVLWGFDSEGLEVDHLVQVVVALTQFCSELPELIFSETPHFPIL